MYLVVHLSISSLLALLLLAGAATAQSNSDANQQMPPQMQSAPDDSARTCTSKAELELNKILEKIKISRSPVGWAVDVPSSQSSLVEGTLLRLQQVMLDCQPLRSIAPIGKTKYALEDLLNSVRVVIKGSRLRAEFGDFDRNQDTGGQRDSAKGIDQAILEKLDAIPTRLNRVEAAVQQERPSNGPVLYLVFTTLILTTLCGFGLAYLMWTLHGNSKLLQEWLDEFHDRLRSSSARAQTIEGRVGAIERQRGLDTLSRGTDTPQVVNRAAEASAISRRTEGAAVADAARIQRERETRADWDRRYQQLLKGVVESMKSFDAFEALKAQYQLTAVERAPTSDDGEPVVLNPSLVDLDKADFWAVELGPHTLMFPGRRLYAIAHALTDMNGQKALSMFADLFDIQWDARDLRIDQAAFIQRGDRGGFTVQQPGKIGLFRRDA